MKFKDWLDDFVTTYVVHSWIKRIASAAMIAALVEGAVYHRLSFYSLDTSSDDTANSQQNTGAGTTPDGASRGLGSMHAHPGSQVKIRIAMSRPDFHINDGVGGRYETWN